MAEFFYIILFLVAGVMVFSCFLHSLRKKTNVGRYVSGAILSAVIVIFSYILALFCKNATLSSVCYSTYFAFNTSISFFLFLFSGAYSKRRKLSKWLKITLSVITVADMLSMYANVILHHIVNYKYVTHENVSHWVFTSNGLFQIHLILCYIFFIVFFLNIGERILNSPKIYKLQYAVIILIMLLCVLGNGLFLLTRLEIDFSVIGYGVTGILLYYFTFEFSPRRLKDNMGKLVLNKIRQAVFLYDEDQNCIFTNDKAREWFGEQADLNLSEFTAQTGLGIEQAEHNLEIPYTTNNKKYYFRADYQVFSDEKKRNIGGYFLIKDVTEERAKRKEREYLSTHDVLTGLLNQNAFYAQAEEVLARFPRTEYYIVTTNIRQFKLVNDFMGRETGDKFLKSIGEAFLSHSREEVVYGRLEGDKFAICLPAGLCKEEDFISKSEAAHEAYHFPLAIVTNYGIYEVTDRSIPVSVMCERANMALNSIKDDAGICVAYYDSKLRGTLLTENQLVSEMPGALEDGQFLLYYQPQIDSRTNKIAGVEALVRWRHPDRGMLYPVSFIPLFERAGLISKLDLFVWEQACRHIRELRKEDMNISISVNISPTDIYAMDLYEVFTELVAKYEIPAQSIKLEITETAALLDVERHVEMIKKLQSVGFTIEMDDFGSGFSSLNMLKDMPVDVLKMDMGFLQEAEDDERSRKVLKSVADLANSLDVILIAEGVEKEEQIGYLSEIGCHYLQGYYYSRPVPFEELKNLIFIYDVQEMEK